MRVISFLLLSFAGLPLALGHDLWVEREANRHTLQYGHERSEHGGAKILDYRPESVKQALCLNGAGEETRASRNSTYPVELRGDCATTWFLVSTGYWSKTPYGLKNLPKNEASMALESWLSYEGVKRIDHWGPGLARPLTQALELTPASDPLAAHTGDKLRLRAWYQGKPAPGVTVAYFGRPRGVTDADGQVNIRLANPGFQLIQASLELPLNDARADKALHSTSLQFELP
jgi:nickel transport protein